MMATVELFVELIVRIPKLFETILPKSHVFEATESFLIRFDPIGTERKVILYKIFHGKMFNLRSDCM